MSSFESLEYLDHLQVFPGGSVYCGQSSATVAIPNQDGAYHQAPIKILIEEHIEQTLATIERCIDAPVPVMLDSTGSPLRGAACSVYNGVAGVLLSLCRVVRAVPPTNAPLQARLLRRMQRLFSVVSLEVKEWRHGATQGVGYYFGPVGAHLVLLESGSLIDSLSKTLSDTASNDDHISGIVGTLRAVVQSLLHLFQEIQHRITSACAPRYDEECHHLAPSLPEAEQLYGVAGTLYSLRLLEAMTRNEPSSRLWAQYVDPNQLTAYRQFFANHLVSRGIAEGHATVVRTSDSAEAPVSSILSWAWHGSRYLGAAHGAAGIVTELLEHAHLLTASMQNLILRTADSIIDTAFAHHGHLPTKVAQSRPGQGGQCTVHWCHGAPGVVWMALAAHRVTGDHAYVAAAGRVTEDVVYPQGLLRKGMGLCHGGAGNGYAFLAMYRATSHPKYLFFAHRFAVMALQPSLGYATDAVATYRDPQRKIPNIPDAPVSLMEGCSGTLCFLAELLYSPTLSAFPGFEVLGSDTSVRALDWATVAEASKARSAAPESGHREGQDAILVHATTHPPSWYVNGHAGDLVEKLSLIAPGIPAVVCRDVFTAVEASGILNLMTASIPYHVMDKRPVRIGATPSNAPLLRYITHLTQQVVSQFPDEFFCPPPTPPRTKTAPVLESAPTNVNKDRMWKRRALCFRDRRAVERLVLTSAYIVSYDTHGHPAIHSHTDSSHVTLNLCLLNTAPKGNLVLEGDAGLHSYRHIVGEALVQRGDLPHHTHRLNDGFSFYAKRRRTTDDDARRAQLVALFEFEEEETDFQAMLFRTSAASIGARLLRDLDAATLGDIALYLPLGDVAKLAACGARVWQRVLDPRVGGIEASMFWCARVLATRRLVVWLPYLWPEYYGSDGEGRASIEPLVGRFHLSKHDRENVLKSSPLSSLVSDVRHHAGITREVAAVARDDTEDCVSTRKVTFGLSPQAQELPPWVAARQSNPDVELNLVQRIDWQMFLRRGLEFVNVASSYFKFPMHGDAGDLEDLDDDGDSGGGTGTSYMNPEVEEEAARLAGVLNDTSITGCWRCLEIVERDLYQTS